MSLSVVNCVNFLYIITLSISTLHSKIVHDIFITFYCSSPFLTETPPTVTPIPPPSQVQGVMLTENGTSLTVSWTAVTDPMYNILYVVRYSTDRGTETDPPSNAMKRSGITVTSTTLTGLQSGTTYYVWVAAEILGAGVQGSYSMRSTVSSRGEVIILYLYRLYTLLFTH